MSQKATPGLWLQISMTTSAMTAVTITTACVLQKWCQDSGSRNSAATNTDVCKEPIYITALLQEHGIHLPCAFQKFHQCLILTKAKFVRESEKCNF